MRSRDLGELTDREREVLELLRRDFTNEQIAQRLDISRQSVNAIETGKYDPSLPLAFRIARLFDMPIEAIFDDK